MNSEGLEMIAVLVVVVLLVKVLDRFGLLAAGYDGKKALASDFSPGGPLAAEVANASQQSGVLVLCFSDLSQRY